MLKRGPGKRTSGAAELEKLRFFVSALPFPFTATWLSIGLEMILFMDPGSGQMIIADHAC